MLNIKYFKKYQKWLRIISSLIFFFIMIVLLFDSKIILKNKYDSSHNYIYLFISLLLSIIYFKFF